MATLQLNGATLHYAEHAQPLSRRPPVVLVHGAGGQYAHWPPHIRRLRDTTTYALDLPGHGKSGGKLRASVTAYAADVLAFMDALGLRRAVVGGHSMGGAIAQTMALNYPDRLVGLLLVGTGARLRVLPDILDGLLTQHAATVELIVSKNYAPGAPDQLVRLGKRVLMQCPPEVIHNDYTACQNFDVMQRLSAIRHPTLIVVGSDDQMTPLNYAEFLRANIPNARLEIIENAGHMVMVEAPQQVAEAIDNWLEEL